MARFRLPIPPPGYYDPAIDASEQAAQRGFFDLGQDTQRDNLRDTVDYGLARDDVFRSRERGLTDLSTRRTQAGQDFSRQRSYGQQDYSRNLAEIDRAYRIRAARQNEARRASGILSKGIAGLAASRNAENRQWDQQPLDTGYRRLVEGIDTAESRFNDEAGTAESRLREDTDLGLGRLALESAPPDAGNPFGGRRFQDRTTALSRAGRELTAFGLSSAAARAAQAGAAGWNPGMVIGRPSSLSNLPWHSRVPRRRR